MALCMHMYTPITIQTCSYDARGEAQGPGIGYGQPKRSKIEENAGGAWPPSVTLHVYM